MSTQSSPNHATPQNAEPVPENDPDCVAVNIGSGNDLEPPNAEEIESFMSLLGSEDPDESASNNNNILPGNSQKRQNLESHDEHDTKRAKNLDLSTLSPEMEKELNDLFGSTLDDLPQRPGDEEVSHDFPWLERADEQHSNPAADAAGDNNAQSASAITPPYSASEGLPSDQTANTSPVEYAVTPTSAASYTVTATTTPADDNSPPQGKEELPGQVTISVDEAAVLSSNLAETKAEILKTHSLVTTYSALKSAYVQVCNINKTQSAHLALYKQRSSEFEKRANTANSKLRVANKKVDELMGIIRRLPDQGSILRDISVLERDLKEKAAEIERLKLLHKDCASHLVPTRDSITQDQRLGDVLSDALNAEKTETPVTTI
ncbi:hypothetical protein BZA70DRAFT_280365, partial [Myxozyma melibiosi]